MKDEASIDLKMMINWTVFSTSPLSFFITKCSEEKDEIQGGG
jgi:hypothetical protein